MAKIFVAAADLGGTKISCAVVDESANLSGSLRVPTSKGTPKAIEVTNRLIDAISESMDASGKKVKAVGIGVPGQLSLDRQRVQNVPNIKGFSGFPLARTVRRELGLPVFLENDARSFTLAEAKWGAAKKFNRVLGVTLGTGVGGGLVQSGVVEHGSHGSAGEIGHTLVDVSGPKCKCGSRGCLEQYASGTAIQGAAGKVPSLKKLDANGVAQLAFRGNSQAKKVFTDMGSMLGAGLASAANLFDPQVIVIGGSVSKSFSLFSASMRKEFESRALPTCRNTPIVKHSLVEPGVIGAGAIAFVGASNRRLSGWIFSKK